MIEIKNRFTWDTIFACEIPELKLNVEKNKSNLRGADLRGANLYGADLECEKLTKTPIQINNLRWFVLITENYLRIGCQRFTHEERDSFDNRKIAEMDGRDALKFWAVWKAPLLAMCAAHKGQ